MEELKKSFELLKFENVKTYIQSGNVIFESLERNPASVASFLENQIKKTFGFDVTVILRTTSELINLVSSAPYTPEMMRETKFLYIVLLSDKPNPSDFKQIDIAKYLPDQFFLRGKELYLYLPNGAGRTKLSNTFFENKLKVRGTMRNWYTLNELIRLTK